METFFNLLVSTLKYLYLCRKFHIMENTPNKETPETIWQELKSKKVSDVGIFKVQAGEFILIRIFKHAVNYTAYGFIMFMTFMVVLITFLVI